jgi:RimJ/RimL family protein N-acetyltransferase
VAAFPDRIDVGLLELRRWAAGDLHDLVAAIDASFDELHRWMAWAATRPTPDSLRSVVDDYVSKFDADEEWQYFIVEVESGQLVGAAGLHRRGGPDELEVGYWVRTDRTGRGYATEVSRALTTAAFESSLGIETVRISMDPANKASAAVPRRLGFVPELAAHGDDGPGYRGPGIAFVMSRGRWRGAP